MEENNLIKISNKVDAQSILQEFMNWYLNPSFGSMTKHDIDLRVFSMFQKVGVLSSNKDVYEIMRILKVTRAKARNLVYESSLRMMQDEQLENHLKELMERPLLEREGEKISIEIDNPLLVDFVRKRLKDLNHLTDGSFSPELIRMSYSAFVDLYVKLFPEKEKHLRKELIKINVKKKVTLSQILPHVLKFAAKTVGGKVLEDFTGDALKYATDWIKTAKENVGAFPTFPKEMFKEDILIA